MHASDEDHGEHLDEDHSSFMLAMFFEDKNGFKESSYREDHLANFEDHSSMLL